MDQADEQRIAPLIEALRQDPGGGSDLPDPAGAIVRAALAGQTVYQIAQDQEMSEEAVWRSLSDAARAASAPRRAAPSRRPAWAATPIPASPAATARPASAASGLDPPEPIPEEPPGPTSARLSADRPTTSDGAGRGVSVFPPSRRGKGAEGVRCSPPGCRLSGDAAYPSTLTRLNTPKPRMSSPDPRLTQRRARRSKRARSRLTTPLSSSHQSADPRNTPSTRPSAAPGIRPGRAQPQPRENGGERQDGQRVGDGQEKRGHIGARQAASARAGRLGGRRRQEGAHPQVAQKRPAQEAEPHLLADQETGHHRQPEGRDRAICRVGGSGAQAGGQAHAPPGAECAPDAEHPNWPHRGGNRQAEQQPAQYKDCASITIQLYGTDRLLCYPAADGTGLRNPPERRLRLLALLQVLLDRGPVAFGLPGRRQRAARGAARARPRPGPLPQLVQALRRRKSDPPRPARRSAARRPRRPAVAELKSAIGRSPFSPARRGLAGPHTDSAAPGRFETGPYMATGRQGRHAGRTLHRTPRGRPV